MSLINVSYCVILYIVGVYYFVSINLLLPYENTQIIFKIGGQIQRTVEN